MNTTSVPEPVRAAVARALAKPAAERFASVSAFVEALTGAPLPQPANRGVSSAIGPVEGASGSETGPRTPHTGRDAFERTVGTGDREAAPVLGLAPTVDSQSRPAGAIDARAHTAPAIASAPSDLASAPSTGEPAPGEPAAVPPALPAPPARRGALLATAVIAAAAAAAAMFVGMGGASRDRRAGAPTVASAGDAPHSDGGVARPSSSAPPVTTAGDAAAASPGSSAPPVTAAGDAPGGAPAASRPGSAGAPQATSSGRAPRTADPRPGAPERIGAPDRDVGPALEPPQSQDDDPRANPNAAAKLRQAETAKDSDRWQEVEKLVNQVLALEDLTPLQRARAHALRGIARCAQHDLQGGRAERNKLVSMRAPRRLLAELARACRQGREPAP